MTTAERLALAVADVNWATTDSLFRELDEEDVETLALRCMDYRNGWRHGLKPWSGSRRTRPAGPRRWTRDVLLPPGLLKRLPTLGMRPIARAIREFWADRPGALRGLVATYPYYLRLADALRPDALLYYNFDDYAHYWPDRSEELRRQEDELIDRADATICTALVQAEEFRRRAPSAAGRIHHVPHGTPSSFLASGPLLRPGPAPADVATLPRPLLGYVGSLEDRLDWTLLGAVADAFPRASVVAIGRIPEAGGEPWRAESRRVLALPNVHALGWRRHDRLPAYYQAFDVNLIPYLVDHPFNRASSPTKIMDGMGATRPIVATSVPECRLYARLFDVAETRREFVAAVGRILAAGSDDGRAALRFEHAAANTCAKAAARVVATLAPVRSRPKTTAGAGTP
jgi:glycosyltransferase involved in cell wall biosynthesis